MGVYMFRDNYLQVKYFDDNASNRFCSQDCACESLFGEYVDYDEVPLDENEEVEEDCDYGFSESAWLEENDNGRSD
jgi:hypothetical protein